MVKQPAHNELIAGQVLSGTYLLIYILMVGGRVADCVGLLNRYIYFKYRGFESPPTHLYLISMWWNGRHARLKSSA